MSGAEASGRCVFIKERHQNSPSVDGCFAGMISFLSAGFAIRYNERRSGSWIDRPPVRPRYELEPHSDGDGSIRWMVKPVSNLGKKKVDFWGRFCPKRATSKIDVRDVGGSMKPS